MNTFNTMAKTNLDKLGLSRFNQILIVVLVLQLVVAGVVLWPTHTSSETGGLVFGGFEIGDVVGLTIIDDAGAQITLRKGPDGWVLPEGGDYPAKEDSVAELLGKVVGLSSNRLVTRTDTSHKRLQVADDDFARKLILETADGQSHTLYIGSSPNVNATNVRLAGQNETYLASGLSVWQMNAQASSWIDPLYFGVATEDITSIRLQNAHNDLTFEKDAEGSWTMLGLAEGENLLENNVKSLANRVASIRMVEPIGTEQQDWFDLGQPQATVTVTTNKEGEGEQTFTIQVGAQGEDKNYVVKASNSAYYVSVASFTVEDLLKRTRDSFLGGPEGETTTGSGNDAPSGSE